MYDYKKAIDINPNNAFIYNNRGSAKGELKDFKGALQDFNKAIELNTKYARAFVGRGAAKFSRGDKEGAYLDWSRTGELGYTDAYEMIKKFCN
jgi:tetratricopeptide (TPR) repeat protein